MCWLTDNNSRRYIKTTIFANVYERILTSKSSTKLKFTMAISSCLVLLYILMSWKHQFICADIDDGDEIIVFPEDHDFNRFSVIKNGTLNSSLLDSTATVDEQNLLYRDVYCVMFDAGSTGTRVHVFHFMQRKRGDSLVLLGEIYDYIKPGLSSYVDDPKQGAESIREMLDLAIQSVPSDYWPVTPIALKATAGLRLLNDNLANILLEEVEDILEASPFKMGNNAVNILDGEDEGLFAWITVNYLNGYFNGSLLDEDSSVILDLGGGSTQITFDTNSKITMESSPEDYVKDLHLFGDQYSVYVHSYLGLGLRTARYIMMGGDESQNDELILTSPCLPVGYTGEWSYNNVVYQINGQLNSGYDACRALALNMIGRQIDQPAELAHRKIYAFSYYFDTAVDAGLITEKGSTLLVSNFTDEARNVCQELSPSPSQPLLCTDLVYISVLLTDGFNLPSNKQLLLLQKVKGVECSWALGASLRLINRLQ